MQSNYFDGCWYIFPSIPHLVATLTAFTSDLLSCFLFLPGLLAILQRLSQELRHGTTFDGRLFHLRFFLAFYED
ncbi:hypothetical protein FA04_03055 [Ensifer adhaerens]|nr:hypothetical protein FA04_03055 [Ensifer adhaerens]